MTKPEGRWEFPGGRLDENESAIQAAIREWQEETGKQLPDGDLTGHWVSNDGKYEGYILTIPSEDALDLEDRADVDNPDDHGYEALAWWDPKQLEDNPSVREEILDDLDVLLSMLSH
jgi:8-oxo-dGTP pyrophosphatase MutT (NUDIX family)